MSEPRPVQVIPVIYDLILWSSAKVGRFPRAHRFTIGDRLITRLTDTLALLVSAQLSPARRAEAMRDANLALEEMRDLFRLAKDLRCLSLYEYEFAVTRLIDAGRQVGGWSRQSRRGAPAPDVTAGAPA